MGGKAGDIEILYLLLQSPTGIAEDGVVMLEGESGAAGRLGEPLADPLEVVFDVNNGAAVDALVRLFGQQADGGGLGRCVG